MSDSEHPPRILDLQVLLDAMSNGELELQGLMPWSSNYTFLASITTSDPALTVPVIYKPQKGERPLWDFPQGTLYKREVAAYIISTALDWNLVPPTVARSGPHGVGSAQLFVDADYDEHYFTLKDRFAEQFRRIALFDIIINNADRKGGHVLLEAEHIWAIDHGIAFHDQYKLRTVIWDWVGTPLEAEEQKALEGLAQQLQPNTAVRTTLEQLLYPREIKALSTRLEALLECKAFPEPHSSRSMPWPPV